MTPRQIELTTACLEGRLTAATAEELCQALRTDPASAREFADQLRLHRQLDFLRQETAAAERQAAARILYFLDSARGANDFLATVRARQVAAPTAGRRLAAVARPRGGPRWLALAAGLALAVAGGLWFTLRPAPLGLRLAESQGAVTVTRAGKAVPVRPGLALQEGDQVTVPEGGKAALKYEAEETTIALHSATATFRAEQGAKRVRLDAGLLVCTAAPQQQPFQIETPQAVAEVVGTRFWLDARAAETTLAVQAGKVALRRSDRHLEVAAGETATANATGVKKLLPGQAWFGELLARAVAGPWDAVDFGQCNTLDRTANCFTDNASGADRRVWQTAVSGTGVVLFDRPALKRGVLVGWVMLLPPGELPPELAPPPSATRIPVVEPDLPYPLTDKRPRAGVCFYRGDRLRPAETLKLFPAFNLTADQGERGVWQRFMVYLDLEAPGGPLVVSALRSAATGNWAAAGEYVEEDGKPLPSLDHGIALLAHETAVLWRGLKFVPLGPDLPPPPAPDTPGNWPLRPGPGGR